MPINFPGLYRSQKIGDTFQIINDTILQLVQTVNGDQQAVASIAGEVVQIAEQQVQISSLFSGPATDGQTLLTLSGPYQAGKLFVYSGGIKHSTGVHYTETDSTHITFMDPRVGGEFIEVIAYTVVGSAGATPIPNVSVYNTIEVPTGTIDSTDGVNGNGTFTLQHVILASTTPRVFIAGTIELVPGSEFSWSGNQIVITPGYKPIPGETVKVEYFWSF